MKRILIFLQILLVTFTGYTQDARTIQAIKNTINPKGINGVTQQLTIAQLRQIRPNYNDASKLYYCTQEGKDGEFLPDFADNSTQDDGAITIVTANNVRLKRKFDGIHYRPEWFGAKGDGYTECSIAIQNTINSIPNSIISKGAIIMLQAGQYKCSQKITLPTNIRVVIQGIAVPMYNENIGTGSSIKWEGEGVCIEYDAGNLAKHNGPIIKGINFITQDSISTFIRLKNITHWEISNCSFKNAATAIELDAGIGVVSGGDNSWGMIIQNVFLDQTAYCIKTTNGTYGFSVLGGDIQPKPNAVGIYIDQYSQHIRLLGTKHDRGNPAIYIAGGHTHITGISIENAKKGIIIDRTNTESVFSGRYNQITASSIVGWQGTELGITLGNLTAYNTLQFEGVNLLSRLTDLGADNYQLFTNGIWRLQNKLSANAVQEYNIGTTKAGEVFASGNGVIYSAPIAAPKVILRGNTIGGVEIRKNDNTALWNIRNDDGSILHKSYTDITNIVEPTNPPPNTARAFVKLNSEGKLQYLIKFPSGSAVVIATEP